MLLLAVVLLGSAYHTHHASYSSGQDVAVLASTDQLIGGAHAVDDASPGSGERHDTSNCQTCVVAAQLMSPPVLNLLPIAAPLRGRYQLVDVQRVGLDPPGLDRPPQLHSV